MNTRTLERDSLVKLAKLIQWAFCEIRLLGGDPQHDRAAALADVFHNLSIEMLGEQDGIDVAFQRALLQRYQERYRIDDCSDPDHVPAFDYVAYFNEVFPP